MSTTESSRPAWLAVVLGGQRNKIIILLQRLKGLGAPGAMNPSIFRKFLVLLDQVAQAHEKELRILDHIEDIEQQHSYRRRHQLLERAVPRPKEVAQTAPSPEAGPDRPRYRLLWLVVLWYLFMRSAINHKKQGLTVD